MRFLNITVVISVLTASLFIANGPTLAAGITEVTFETDDYTISGPDNIMSGLVSVRVVNKGKDLHHIQFLRLDDEKSIKDYSAAAKANPPVIYGNLSWVEFDGGPNAVIPGESASAILNLRPGNYVVACIVPDPKGVPHVNLGMVKTLAVRDSIPSEVLEPEAAITITAHDFGFSVSSEIHAGKQEFRFNNEGGQAHEVLLVQLPPGKTIGDFAAAFAPGASGPPPGKPIGGLTGVFKGGHQFFTADLQPGHYGLICFFEDALMKAPHFALGMTSEFDVK